MFPSKTAGKRVRAMAALVSSATFLPSELFSCSLDREPFVFHHTLNHSDLFTTAAIKRLIEQIGRLPAEIKLLHLIPRHAFPGYFLRKGKPPLKWGTPEFLRELNEAFDDLEHSQVRIKLSSIQQIEPYGEMLRHWTRELSAVTHIDFEHEFRPGLATLFITSPGEVTPYHIDEETNFLLQIRGSKHAQLYDGNDRRIVTHEDLERYYEGVRFIEQRSLKPRWPIDIQPGTGVHNPPFFPHKIINGPNVSISLSLGFEHKHLPNAQIHRMNLYLRKVGLHPSNPGKHPTADTLKCALIRKALTAKRTLLGYN